MAKQEIIWPYEVTSALDLNAADTYDPTNLDLKLEWVGARTDEDGAPSTTA